MKNLKYLLAMLIAITAFSCVEDDVVESEKPPVVGGEIKLNEIMSTGSPDWLELYNISKDDIQLGGYVLGDSNSRWTIPDMVIPAGGHIAFDCDGKDTNGSTNFKISSGGEKIVLLNPAGEMIDEITTPDMSSQQGLTYGREVDGGDTWVVMSPTKGKPNSTVNEPPVLIADPLTEHTDVYAVKASDADGIQSVKLIHMVNEGVQTLEMALVGEDYKVSVPHPAVGSVVKYYVVATDNTGLQTFYPENGTENPGEFTVVGGLSELEFAGEEAGNRGDVTFTATPYYPEQVDEVRLYYLKDGELQDDTNDDKHKVVMDRMGDVWQGVIPAQETGDVVRYYLRVEYLDGTKTYYPMEVEGGDFNHDYGTTWPSYTVEEKSYDPVEYTTVTYNEGPLTKITFPSNPVPGEDINVELEYSSSVSITEARIYFDVGDNPEYVKKNKIKGEDLDNFTQTGVTINMKDAVADNGLAVGESGNKTSFYVRMQDADGNEYYYDKNGNMHLDNTGSGGTTDESDAFKADPTLWNSFIVQ